MLMFFVIGLLIVILWRVSSIQIDINEMKQKGKK